MVAQFHGLPVLDTFYENIEVAGAQCLKGELPIGRYRALALREYTAPSYGVRERQYIYAISKNKLDMNGLENLRDFYNRCIE